MEFFFGFLFQKPDLGSPDSNLKQVLGPSERRIIGGHECKVGLEAAYFLINCYPESTGKLGHRSWPYWHQHILLDASIQFLDQIWKSAATSISAIFFRKTIPLGFLLKIDGIFFSDFVKKPDLGSPDSNLSKFYAHPNARS